MAEICIKNLLVRTQVGFNDHELGKKQDLLINLTMEFDAQGEEIQDDPEKALDYRTICKEVIEKVEGMEFKLIEAVAHQVLKLVLKNTRVKCATVEIDKPHALRFSESVSVKLSGTNS